MSNKVFSASDSMKSEYCCSVVKIGELKPIEGSDFLAETIVRGTQVVVRKDQVHEGDIMFYAENETTLNDKFLSLNNLYEIGCRDMNSNADEVNAIMQEYIDNFKNKADSLRAEAKNLKNSIENLTKRASKLNNQVKKLTSKLESLSDKNEIDAINEEIKEKESKADEYTQRAIEKNVTYNNLKASIERINEAGKPIVDKAKRLTGFFGKYGRVRMITLQKVPSFGFIFSVNEMAKYAPEVQGINLEDYLDIDFDTVNGELFVKAYVPPIKPQNERKSRGEKRNKKLNQFNRLIDGEFKYHYDTIPLQKNMHCIKPEDTVAISVKVHGTSIVIGKLHVKQPKKIVLYKRLWNKFVDTTGLFSSTRYIDYDVVYGPIYSSRTVIKNKYINSKVNSGYYNTDIWSEYGDIIYPYLNEGMTIYGEIFGYLTGSETMIQKHYDYGCEVGTNKLMVYRITSSLPNGTKYEWNVDEVKQWTEHLINVMKAAGDENAKRIHVIDLLYHGTIEELYPEIDTKNHWCENTLEAMKNDKKHFGMEELEPLCNTYNSPREGICLRIDNDKVLECFKLKTNAFRGTEAILVDAGEVDIEMADAYSEETQETNG